MERPHRRYSPREQYAFVPGSLSWLVTRKPSEEFCSAQ